MIRRFIPIIIVAACSAFFASCGNNAANNDSNNAAAASIYQESAFEPAAGLTKSAQENRLVIKLVVNDTYGKETACACIHDLACREYDELLEILDTKYNIDLQLTYQIEEFYIKDSLLTKKFDGALCKPWFALRLMPENGFNFKRIADLLDVDNNQWLWGLFIVKTDSPVSSMKEIGGKTLVIGQNDSYEKYHASQALLANEKIVPGSILNKSGCLESVGVLLDNKADVAVISNYALTASCAVDIAGPNDFKVIGETDKIPLCSVMLDMNKVSEADALRLQSALLEISGDNAPAGLISRGFVAPAKWRPTPVNE